MYIGLGLSQEMEINEYMVVGLGLSQETESPKGKCKLRERPLFMAGIGLGDLAKIYNFFLEAPKFENFETLHSQF